MIKLSAKGKSVLGIVIYIPAMMFASYLSASASDFVSKTFKITSFYSQIPGTLLTLSGTLLATYLVIRIWHRIPFSEIGLGVTRKTGKLLSLGILTGALLISLFFATAIITRQVSIQHVGPIKGSRPTIEQHLTKDQLKSLSEEQRQEALKEYRQAHTAPQLIVGLFVNLIVFLVGALNEEIFCRGYILKTFARGFGIAPALIMSSLLFGFFHTPTRAGSLITGPNLLFAFNLALLGAILGLAFLLAKSLWLPVAIHFAWNYFQGPVYGFAVSGLYHPPELLQLARSGPNLLTGGTFGPEGSLIVSIICIIVLITAFSLTDVRRRVFLQ